MNIQAITHKVKVCVDLPQTFSLPRPPFNTTHAIHCSFHSPAPAVASVNYCVAVGF